MTSCPLCLSCARLKFCNAERPIWKCSKEICGLEFTFPQLDDDELNRAYAALYYPSSGNGLSHGPERENTPFDVLHQAFHFLAQRCGDLRGMLLLDYGCGEGRLCAVARQHGMITTGVEQSAAARMKAQQEGAFPAYPSLDELLQAEPEARFDLITLWDVIEHLRAPWRDIRNLYERLQPGGRLLISTMNTKSLRSFTEGRDCEYYADPTHLFFFDRQSLRKTITAGTSVAADEWIFPIRYSHHGFFRSAFHRLLTALSLNSEIVFVATKPLHP